MLWKVVLSLCAVVGVTTAGVVPGGVSSQASYKDLSGNFAFNYHVTDPLGATKGRAESGDAFGNRIGSYAIRDLDGRARHVNYIADAAGFRAAVNTNEPGTTGNLVTHGFPAVAAVHAAAPVAYARPAAYFGAPAYGAAPSIYTTPRFVSNAPVYGANIHAAFPQAPYPVSMTNHYAPVPIASGSPPVFVEGSVIPPFRATVPAIDYTREQIIHQSRPVRPSVPDALPSPPNVLTPTFQPEAPQAPPAPGAAVAPTFSGDTEEAPANVATPTFSRDTEQAPANVRTPTFNGGPQQFSFGSQGFSNFQSSSFRSPGVTYAADVNFNVPRFGRSVSPSEGPGPAPRSSGAPPPNGSGPAPGPPEGGPPPPGPGPNKIKGIRITTARPVRFEIVQKTVLAHVEPVIDVLDGPLVPTFALDIPRK